MSKKNSQLGNNLGILRDRFKLSQQQVADGVGVTRKTIYNWEQSNSEPDASELDRLGKIYKVEPREIIEKDFSHSGAFNESPANHPTFPLKQKCREHLNAFLETCTAPEHLGWTYYELREKFPLDKFNSKPASSAGELLDVAVEAIDSEDPSRRRKP